MEIKTQKRIFQLEVWGVFEVLSSYEDYHNISLVEEEAGTFFINKECAEYAAYAYTKMTNIQHIALKQLIPVNDISQNMVYGVQLYFGNDMYLRDDEVFANEDDPCEYSELYQYFKNHTIYEEVEDPDDEEDVCYGFSEEFCMYYINRDDLDSLKSNYFNELHLWDECK